MRVPERCTIGDASHSILRLLSVWVLHEHPLLVAFTVPLHMLHHSLKLDYNADSVECCPQSGLQSMVAVGTYQLDEATRTRHGRIYLYHVNPPSKGVCADMIGCMDRPSPTDSPHVFRSHRTVPSAGCTQPHIRQPAECLTIM